tara:strand:+ start:396 stop:1253 length:858 start_codon:yes stop_codon:yes gene_type:complete
MTQKFSIKGFADNSITGEKIAGFTTATDGYVMAKSSGSITWQQMDSDPTMGGDLTGTASNAQIAANAVGTTELATNAVTTNEIATNAVGVTELNVTAGTTGQALTIDGGGALGFTTIVTDPTMGGDMTGTASNAQIAADAVTANEIAAGAVGSTEIAAGAVGSTELADNSVTSDKIGVDVIVAEDIAANAITVAELQDGAVTTAKIAADAVTANEIATGAITSGKIHNSVSMGGPSQGTGSIIRTNSNSIGEDIILASDTNGVTMGPVTVTVGNTVTVNGQWKVI